MRENRVAEPRIGQISKHGRLDRGHDLAGLGANHGEAKNAVIVLSDKSLHEPLCFFSRLCSQDRAYRELREARAHALVLRIAFAQSHVGKLRVREQAYGINRSLVLRFPSARLSRMIRKSSTET